MKLTKRKGFNFFRSYYDVYNELSDKDKVAFMDALLDRQFLGKKPTDLKGMAKFAYISQTNSIDSQVKGYESKTGKALDGGNKPPTEPPTDGGVEPPCQQVQVEVQGKVEVQEEGKEQEQDVKRKRFPALEELKLWGVDEQTAKDFLQNRKLKKLSNTETAFKNLLNEINKTNRMPSEIITICAERGWGSFKASWDWQEQSNTNGKKRGEGVNAEYLQELQQRLNPNT